MMRRLLKKFIDLIVDLRSTFLTKYADTYRYRVSVAYLKQTIRWNYDALLSSAIGNEINLQYITRNERRKVSRLRRSLQRML